MLILWYKSKNKGWKDVWEISKQNKELDVGSLFIWRYMSIEDLI